jgi:flagellar export protein FliJ
MRKSSSQLLLQLRALHEQLSRRDLGTATVAAATAETALEARTAALADTSLPEHTDPARFAAAIATRSALASLATSQRVQVVLARAEVEQAAARWLAAEREREAADRLVENEREQARDDADAAAQREADDLAVARHGRDLDGGAS